MKPKFEIKDQLIILQWESITTSVNLSDLCMGHFGCKLLGTLKSIPVNLASTLPKGWKSTKDAKLKLSQSLQVTLGMSKLEGAVLWDTMRTGSDYWRPGKLLLDAVEMLPPEFQKNVSYAREDCLCPPQDLLKNFLAESSTMTFGEYAQRYAEYLHQGDKLPMVAAHILLNISLKKIPLFYCVDPYIPGYARKNEFCSDTPYMERQYLPELRTEGCHRLILVEEIIKFFLELGTSVENFELDQSFGTVQYSVF